MNHRCEFIAAKKGHRMTNEARHAVGVSKSTWYRWCHATHERAQKDQQLRDAIQSIWADSGEVYGLPRIMAELRDLGYLTNHKRVARWMRADGIASVMPYRPAHARARELPVLSDDLVGRKFWASAPDRIWVSDITYIRTDEGWLYLAAIVDLYSRKVVGFALGIRATAALVEKALRSAIRKRRPQPGLIFHSDRGCQYTSKVFRRALRKARMLQSMGRIGHCADNAVAESFWASLKKERIGWWSWETRAQARRVVLAYIPWYNAKRRHSYLAQTSPDAFEAQHAA